MPDEFGNTTPEEAHRDAQAEYNRFVYRVRLTDTGQDHAILTGQFGTLDEMPAVAAGHPNNLTAQLVNTLQNIPPRAINAVNWTEEAAQWGRAELTPAREYRTEYIAPEASTLKYGYSDKAKEIIIDKATLLAIGDITTEIITKATGELETIYRNKLDFLIKNDYTNLLECESEDNLLISISGTKSTWEDLNKGVILGDCRYHSECLKTIEKVAKQKYDIEESKYKYYPRMKAKVKFGNKELLSQILKVTRIKRGKVICQ